VAAPHEVVESVVVRAPIDGVWAAVSDPCGYGRWSPEALGAVRRSGSGPWAVGDTFTGRNKVWVPWTTQCRVVASDPEREFAFEVALGPVMLARWAYELREVAGGTEVTERWTDRRDGPVGSVVRPIGVFVGRGVNAAERNRVTMRATLDALWADLESAT